jgi:choline dehydrogenase-like flavoprotein
MSSFRMHPAQDFDAIVIGSGFGGVLAAHPLVQAGWRVLMLERGDWVVRGPQNWAPAGVRELSPYYDRSTPYAISGDHRGSAGALHCVGGASVFYGGVALRYRERDFRSTADERKVDACWPFDYAELEPYYSAAETLIGVCGEPHADPTEPWRSAGYPQGLPPLSRIGCRVSDAAARLGLTPFRLPLAINYSRLAGRNRCIGCSTCDGHACAISAKNDVASALLPQLLADGLQLAPNHAAVRLVRYGHRITAVECVHTRTGEKAEYSARVVIVAAGALATPHLLLASELAPFNPAGHLVGRFLTRHCNAVVLGVFPRALDPAREFHKQIGINDFYFGSDQPGAPPGKLGTIQQIHGPPPGMVELTLPRPLARLGLRLLDRVTGMIVIASDEPQYQNRVALRAARDRLGMPAAAVHHDYTRRDRAARRVLARAAKSILHEAGASLTVTVKVRTFSHALGTVRMGDDPERAPLAADGRFRGIDNLYIADGSALPTPAGVNPSLTIAAVALRTGCLLAHTTAQHTTNVPARQRITIPLEIVS